MNTSQSKQATEKTVAERLVPTLRNDPLTKITRSLHRQLLIMSSVAITIVHVGITPTQFSLLGVNFDPINLRALLVILVVIQGYFVVSFYVALHRDLCVWKIEKEHIQKYIDELKKEATDTKEFLEHYELTHIMLGGDATGFYQPLVDENTAIEMWEASLPYDSKLGKVRYFLDAIMPFCSGIYGILACGYLLATKVSGCGA